MSLKVAIRDYKHRPPAEGRQAGFLSLHLTQIEAEHDLHLTSHSKVCRTDDHFVLHYSLASLGIASGANPSLPESRNCVFPFGRGSRQGCLRSQADQSGRLVDE